MHTRRLLRICVLGIWFACPPAQGGVEGTAAGVDPEVEKILRGMSEHLHSLQQFSFQTENTSDEILVSSGQRLQFGTTVEIFVRRPSRLRANIRGDLRDQELFYDGKTITLLNRNPNLYASIDAPGLIDGAMNFARESFALVAPLADFIYANAGDALMENVESALYAGLHRVHGVECHHLAFTQDDIDWQIWIENSQTPVPRKLVITDKQVEGMPQFAALLLGWNLSADLKEDLFRFSPPRDAERIEFLPLKTAKGKGE
jgi:hypothetical protein